MANRAAGTVWVVLVVCGCHGPPAGGGRSPSVVPGPTELPRVTPAPVEFELRSVPRPEVKPPAAVVSYRGLTEPACQALAAENTPAANLFDGENEVGGRQQHKKKKPCDEADRTRRMVRYYTALELRNQSAAAALERYFQLADAEARAGVVRQIVPVIDRLHTTAEKAKAAGVRYPLDPADLDRQRGQLLGQLEQAETGVKLLNIDLRRRLGLPADGAERLWPTGDFGVDGGEVNESAAVATALAERPELRGWRALYTGLSNDTLPAVRDALKVLSPLLGSGGEPPTSLCELLLTALKARCGPDAAAQAELEVRRRQLADVIAARERAVADETRAAVIGLNAQSRRVGFARERADVRKSEWDEAKKRTAANLPGAELAEAQAEVEWLKARAELTAEVMAWHAARVKLKAAQGRLAWETAPPGSEPTDCGGRPAGRVSCR